MTDEQEILTHIHGLFGDKDPDIVGQMSLADGCLELRGGAITIRVEILTDQGRRTASKMVHAHVIARFSGIELQGDEGSLMPPVDLPACVVGIDQVREMALFDVARVWVDLVSGPVLSLLLGEPVFDSECLVLPGTPWPAGCEGWVGPVGFRFAESAAESIIGEAPVFQDAVCLANPQRVHLAKATLDGAAGPDWRYTLEINGHEATYSDPTWNDVGEPTHGGIAIRFAAFHHLAEVDWVEKRQAVDDAILQFVQLHVKLPNDETLKEVVEAFLIQIDDQRLAVDITTFSPIAAARIVFGDTVKSWPDVFHFVQPGGQLSEPRRLMSEVTFARAMGLREVLCNESNLEGLKNCAMRSSEMNSINSALNQTRQLENLSMLPPLIPVGGANATDVAIAMQQLVDQLPKKSKPWWRFWA